VGLSFFLSAAKAAEADISMTQMASHIVTFWNVTTFLSRSRDANFKRVILGSSLAAASTAAIVTLNSSAPRVGSSRLSVPAGSRARLRSALLPTDLIADAGVADNLPKAVLDLLVAHQVIDDDAKAVDVRTRSLRYVRPGRHRARHHRAGHGDGRGVGPSGRFAPPS